MKRISPELITRCFGLVSTSENTRVVLPLKGVECEFSIMAGLAEVRMMQIFRQENAKPLDCEYLFPLPADASVYACEADINGRIIRAAVKERYEAVRLAAAKKAGGRRVALVEAERENLFTLTLNNLQPGDLILVTLKYIQPLRHLAELTSVEVPLCPGIRYIPGSPLIRSNRGKGVVDDSNEVPDASRISPVRLEPEHPDAAFIEIRGRLDGKFVETNSILSPSHEIIVRQEGGGKFRVELSGRGEILDRDFVLRWREADARKLSARAWVEKRGEEEYALMEIRAPKASGSRVPMDFYFLVDHSGSMQGIKWEKAALAVQTCVKNLSDDDRVMVTLFSEGFRDFAEQPLPPVELLRDPAFQGLQQFMANGGTVLGPALGHVVQAVQQHSRDRHKSLILITDAQVGNEARILKNMEGAADLPVHCFGIDIALNDAFLLALARQQRGTFQSLNPADDVAKIVADLAESIRRPVLRNLNPAEGWELAGEFIPPLYSGQVFHLSARSKGGEPLGLVAQGSNSKGKTQPIPLESEAALSGGPYLNWCKQRIQWRISQERNRDAVTLSIESNLICPLTAFIAWDAAEKVAVASHVLLQPNLRPDSRSGLCHFVSPDVAYAAERKFDPGIQYFQQSQLSGLKEYSNDPLIIPFKAESFTIESGSETLTQIFAQVVNSGNFSELGLLYERIINWARQDDTDALKRFNLAAELLARLLEKALPFRRLRRPDVAQGSYSPEYHILRREIIGEMEAFVANWVAPQETA